MQVINSIKKFIMKSIKNNSTILLFNLIFIMGVGFSACSEDDTVVPAKTLEEYKIELSDLVSSELVVVQNTTKGYNKGEFYTSDSIFEVITSSYMDSLLLAEEILLKPDLTIADIIYANYAITQPGNVFNGRVFGQLALSRALGDHAMKKYGVTRRCAKEYLDINLENQVFRGYIHIYFFKICL